MKVTTMTEQDLVDARAFADGIIAKTTDMRGPTVVAGIALALAAAAHLAECGPVAAGRLFEKFYADLSAAMAKEPKS